jgi:hypothetical protein
MRPIWISAAVVVIAQVGQADTINFANNNGPTYTGVYNTGVAGSAYQVVGPGVPLRPTFVATQATFPVATYYVPAGASTFPTSQWVLTQATPPGNAISDAQGMYTFTTTFTLPTGFTAAQLAGRVMADNEVLSVSLNGGPPVLVGDLFDGLGAFTSGFVDFSIDSGFQSGVNTLAFLVNNYDGDSLNPVGLNVQITSATAQVVGSQQSAVPEPLSVAVFGGLLSVSGWMTWRRRS